MFGVVNDVIHLCFLHVSIVNGVHIFDQAINEEYP